MVKLTAQVSYVMPCMVLATVGFRVQVVGLRESLVLRITGGDADWTGTTGPGYVDNIPFSYSFRV